MKRFITVFALVFTVMFSLTAYAGEWKQDDTGWWYQNDDGSYITNDWLKDENGDWYHFDDKGYMQTGFTQVYDSIGLSGELHHSCYYFDDESGKMRTGWIKVYYPDGISYREQFFADDPEQDYYGKWIMTR